MEWRMQDTGGSVCDVIHPPVERPLDYCRNRFAAGKNYVYRRVGDAVGHFEIEEDRISCSGVLLNGDSKTHVYFLTAARCLPNEKHVGRARIQFVGACAMQNTYTKMKVYAISRRLGYVIFRVEAKAEYLRTLYGFLRLNPASRVTDEEVFIAHYAPYDMLQRITNQIHGSAITIEAYERIQGCAVELPKSRASYKAPRMDGAAIGAPVVSTADGAIVALHLCGDCSVSSQNSALRSYTILVDLSTQALSIPSFTENTRAKN